MNRQHVRVQANAKKVVLVDDDQVFGKLMNKEASGLGVQLDYFDSLESIGFISKLKDYDIIIVDFMMEHINGIEIAAYIPSFFQDKRLVLISNTHLETELNQPLPDYIDEFVHKKVGTKEIINRALNH
ncbi:MAG: response regulator [Pseudobacteriovorax sp.]|nr:response regulator [Pseudobacteriovorax sp.]